jgi:hypothetical protein
MISNVMFYNLTLFYLNPAAITVRNPPKESRSLAEKLAWLVFVDLRSMNARMTLLECKKRL